MIQPLKKPDALGTTLIQCPACSAKFGVRNELLKNQETPNFHCSKCDNVFKVNVKELKRQQPLPLTPPDLKSVPKTSKTLKIPSKATSKIKREAPHETNHQEAENELASESEHSVSKGKKIHRTKRLTANWLRNNPLSYMKGTEKKKNSQSSIPVHLQDKPHLKTSGLSKGEWKDLRSLVTPIFIFLFALMGVSYYFIKTPQHVNGIITTLLPSAPRTSPPGLMIQDTEFKKVSLDTGESISIISGTLTNNTKQNFNNIQLEGQAFDTKGLIIVSSKANASSDLRRTRLKSLSTELILSLQSTKARGSTLRPGDSQKFTIAMLGTKLERAAFFSVRIYSVKQTTR